MQPLDFLALSLATFYIAHAVANTHGPFGVFGWLRDHAPLGGLTACIVCLAVWVSIVGYLILQTAIAPVVWAIAPAGGAVLLWRYTGGSHV